jgi:Tol biopolymer transport system component
VKVVDRLLYKTKGGYGRPFFADDHVTHVWVVPATGGEPELITPGKYYDHSICWSPDGLHIAFISNRTSDPDNNQQNDLWRVSIQTRQVTRLTEGPGTAFQPRWSPDGKLIAHLAITSKVSTNPGR